MTKEVHIGIKGTTEWLVVHPAGYRNRAMRRRMKKKHIHYHFIPNNGCACENQEKVS